MKPLYPSMQEMATAIGVLTGAGGISRGCLQTAAALASPQLDLVSCQQKEKPTGKR